MKEIGKSLAPSRCVAIEVGSGKFIRLSFMSMKIASEKSILSQKTQEVGR